MQISHFSRNELQTLLGEVINLSKQVGKILSSYFYQGFSHSVKIKIDQSPVTAADIAANTAITTVLQQLTPGIPILSEENIVPDFSVRQLWARYWLVDPLDGTRGFICHNAEFCVNIALIVDKQPVLGVIYGPIAQQCTYAIAGQKAYFEKQNETPSVITSSAMPTIKSLRFICGHFDRSLRVKGLLQSLFENVSMQKMNSALKFSALAQGEADLYVRLGPTSEWDTAAGQCIVEASGGAVVDFQGHALQYNAKPSLINPSFLAVRDTSLLEKLRGKIQ